MAGRVIPTWQLKLLRRFPRIAFAVPVEVLLDDVLIEGTSRNLSAGGMLLDANCQLPPQTAVCVSFQLPTGLPIRALARVIHCRPGERLGIEFTHMGNADWNALNKAIDIKESFQRRSIRIPERLMVELHWHRDNSAVQGPAQTILLSRHGCLLQSQMAPPPAAQVVIWSAERHMGATAKVISCEQAPEGLAIIALEFACDANFWGIDFKPWDWQRQRQWLRPEISAQSGLECQGAATNEIAGLN